MAAVKKRTSLAKECAAYDCSSRSYYFEDGVRKPTGNVSFIFPKDTSAVRDWCNLIKRQNGKDGFKVSGSTYVCSKHFLHSDVRRPPGGTRHSLRKGARPLLHSWNNFMFNQGERKPPMERLQPVPPTRSESLSPPVVKKPCSSSAMTETIPAGEVDFNIYSDQAMSSVDDGESELMKLRSELAAMKLALAEEKTKNDNSDFVEHVMKNERNINHYTGFPSKVVFDALFSYLNPGENGENILLYNSQSANENETRGRKRMLTPLHSFILTLVRLRRNFDVGHLSYLFKVSEGTVSNTISTWINFLYVKLGAMSIWPSAQSVKQNMTASMREKFPHVKCIIDCVEFKVAVPSSLTLHKMMYSEYKSHTTVKVLVGIAPSGGFTFISSAFPGSISDKQITIKSGILNPDIWEPGEKFMADRGFTVEDQFQLNDSVNLNPLNQT